jgi:NtrC-family two-component system response regulator AlgB
MNDAMPLNPTEARPLRIAVVDDETNIRVTLGLCLEAGGHQVVLCASAADALGAVARQPFDLIFLDVRLGVSNGLDLIPRILAESPWAKVVVITAYASAETAIVAMDRGAADYLPKPFTPAQVQLVTRKVIEQRKLELKLGALETTAGATADFREPVTTSSEMRQALDLARRLAPSDTTLLIRGEPGIGKEWLARAIHHWSGRETGACAAISCRNASADALEEELFGISRRDAPDAPAVDRGAAALCDRGTLILREIGATPLTVQPKILRLVRQREYERYNDVSVRQSDARVIATTSQDLDQAASRDQLRPDLLFAVNIVQIELPPLRQRTEDIVLLAEQFRAAISRANHRPTHGFSAEASDTLAAYAWPGNIRELRNVVERAVMLCEGGNIGLEHLPPQMLCRGDAVPSDLMPLDALEEMHIRRVLQTAKSMEAAAAILGVDPTTLWRRRKLYGL